MKKPPSDPVVSALARAQLSRRSLLRGAGALGAVAALAACGTNGALPTAESGGGTGGGGTGGSGSIKAATDRSATEKQVNWANWTLYLDYDDKTKKYPTLEEFQKQTGITASYTEDVDGNESYYGKIQGQLRNGQDIKQDIIVFTDWMAARCISNGFVQKFDLPSMPNRKNILSELALVDFDPGRQFSLTWQSGFAGVAWNKEKLPKGLKSVKDLWQPELKGRIEVLDEMRDTIGLILLSQGVDISAPFTEAQFTTAADELDKRISDGYIRQVKGNSYKEDLISGDAVAVIGWSGDIFQLNAENDNKFGFALPDSGGTLWSDNMLIPIGSPHKANAEKLMNYYYDPKVAAEVAAYVNYVCPVDGAQDEMEKIDPELAKSTLIFPDKATLKDAKVFRSLTPDEETSFSEAFQKVIGN